MVALARVSPSQALTPGYGPSTRAFITGDEVQLLGESLGLAQAQPPCVEHVRELTLADSMCLPPRLALLWCWLEGKG